MATWKCFQAGLSSSCESENMEKLQRDENLRNFLQKTVKILPKGHRRLQCTRKHVINAHKVHKLPLSIVKS